MCIKGKIILKFKPMCLILATALLLTVVSCGQSKPNAGASGNVHVEEEDILNDVVSKTENGGFQFQKIDWKTKREEIKKKVPGASYEEKLTRLKTQEEQDGKEIVVIYNLQDDQFCSGEFVTKFNDKSDYESFVTKVKAQANDFFKEQPMGNSLDDLLEGEEVSWEGRDKSYVRICPSGEGDYNENAVSIKVEAPKDL